MASRKTGVVIKIKEVKRMKFIRYSKFNGFDVFGVNLGDLMQSLSDSLLDSGFNEDYYWTRQRNEPDDSLDALRQALLAGFVGTRNFGRTRHSKNARRKRRQIQRLTA